LIGLNFYMKWHVYEHENDYESGMSKDSIGLGLGQGDNGEQGRD
jgi:hypothetical protein